MDQDLDHLILEVGFLHMFPNLIVFPDERELGQLAVQLGDYLLGGAFPILGSETSVAVSFVSIALAIV